MVAARLSDWHCDPPSVTVAVLLADSDVLRSRLDDLLQLPSCLRFVRNRLPVSQSTTEPLQVPVIRIGQMRQAGVARKRYLGLGSLELLLQKKHPSTYCMRCQLLYAP